MNNATVSLMFGAGLGAWVYYKLMQHTGGQVKTSLSGASIVGGIAILILFTLLQLVFKI